MYKAVLFDLDGTLLPVNTKFFIHKYFELMKVCVKSIYQPDEFVKHVWQGSKAMIESTDDSKTNQQVFFEYFNQAVDLSEHKITDFFTDFYENQFPKLQAYIGEPNNSVPQLVNGILDQNIKVAVATNPLFPKEAIHHRLSWLDLNFKNFHLVTTYQNMHFTKPSLRYYKEICNKLDLKPEDIIMVGNDASEDLIAQKLGMDVFLVTDYLIDDYNLLEKMPPKYRGSFLDMENSLFQNLLIN